MTTLRPIRGPLCLAVVLLLIVAVSPCEAQQKYRNYVYDSTFYLGASQIPDVAYGRDSLHFRFSQVYQRGLQNIKDILAMSFAGTAYDTVTHHWLVSDSISARRDSVRKELYVESQKPGFGVIFTPSVFGDIIEWCRTADHYVVGPEDLYYTELVRNDSIRADTPWVNNKHLLMGFKVDSSIGHPSWVGVRPRYTARMMNKPPFWYYDTAYHVSKNPALRAADSAAKDSSGYFGVYITLRAEQLDREDPRVNPEDVIAYAVLYRRVRDGQRDYTPGATYKGNIYAMVDTLRITKRMLTDNTLHKNEDDGYVTVHTFVKLDTFAGLVDLNSQFVYSTTSIPYFGPGDPGSSDTTQPSGLAIRHIYDSLRAAGIIPADSYYRDVFVPADPGNPVDYVDQADFHYRFFTTRLVPITFLRGRIANHLASLLESGALDSLIRDEVDTYYADSRLRAMTFRLGMVDELFSLRMRPFSLMSQKVQRFAAENPFGAGDTRGYWVNPQSAYDAARILTNDLDSSSVKIIPMMARQQYSIIDGMRYPITYMNPDSLGVFAAGTLLRFGDTLGRMIAVNTLDDYRTFNAQLLGRFGAFYDYRTNSGPASTKLSGPWLPMLARAVDVSRFKYARRPETRDVPSNPVWNVVQVFGALGGIIDKGYYDGTFVDHPWPTPEEIAMQCWLSLATGVSGLVFADYQYDSYIIGVMGAYSKDRSIEYGSIYDQDGFDPPSNPARRIDSIWIGLKSRSETIWRVCDEIYRVDTTVGWRNLLYNQEQMSLFDSRQSFATMPMLDTVLVERPRQYDSALAPYDPPRYDTRDSSYMEITHFRAGSLQAGSLAGSRYLLFANRRCWPIDFQRYGAKSRVYGGDSLGLGTIDVRRPVVVLKNSTGVIADSFLVERVGTIDPWTTTAAIGDTVPLAWLEPGWGALYRITPIPRGVSEFGTAFSNAVRSLNPSSDATPRDRIVVYERDSVVYLRAVDAASGVWSKEWMISDADDTTNVGDKDYVRYGENLYPTVATADGGHSCLVVWERHDGLSGDATIEARYIDSLPTRTRMPGSTRLRLDSGNTLTASWMRLMPSVVGVHGGYVSSWSAAPLGGIEVVAIRDVPGLSVGADVSVAMIAKATASDPDVGFTPDSNAWHSTLASVRSVGSFYPGGINGGGGGGGGGGNPLSLAWEVAHLAYQQGTPDGAMSQYIFYDSVGARFPSGQQPMVSISATEHVSKGLDGCGFLHPSIAVDSLRIGVAFQINTLYHRYVVLRFRDSLDAKGRRAIDTTGGASRPIGPWTTPVYKWGGDFWTMLPNPGPIPLPFPRTPPIYYERPSLTEFPAVGRSTLLGEEPGGLSWVSTKIPFPFNSLRSSEALYYRYGWLRPQSLVWGHYPTMMLAPYKASNPFAATGILYRGDSTRRFWGEHPYFDSVRYYPGYVVNLPDDPSVLFSARPSTTKIYSYVTLRSRDVGCGGRLMSGGIGIHDVLEGSDGFSVPRINRPGLPTTFFKRHERTAMKDVDDGSIVTSTEVFQSDTTAVAIDRVIIGGDELTAWLNVSPYDTVRMVPANIYMYLELVRAVDSAVLWRSDTVTGRGVDTTVLQQTVTVPTDTATPTGTMVFIRLRTEVSSGLDYAMEAGFHFSEIPVEELGKRWQPVDGERKESRDTAGESPTMRLSLVPNPARDATELRLTVTEPGLVRVSTYDALGEQVASLPPEEFARAGEYRRMLSTGGLRPGIYIVVAESERGRATARLVVAEW